MGPGPQRPSLLLGALLTAALAACNMPAQSAPPQAASQSALGGADAADPAAEMPPIDLSEPELGLDLTDDELAECGPWYSLSFNHHLTVTVMNMTMEHSLGGQTMVFADTNLITQEGGIQSGGGLPPMTYTVSGQFGDCTLSGQGSMRPSVVGSCQDGVVTLTILETWEAGQGTMTCPDSDEPAPFQFPALGQMAHDNVVFHLRTSFGEVSGLTGAHGGDIVERPFAAGSGSHTWSLTSHD